MPKQYDVAAYIWPAYTGDEPRSRMFWPEGIGEWESVRKAVKKTPDHSWPRKPLWGYVNEADPYVMEMQIDAAADHGVNVFIYDWYWYDRRPFLENCLNDGYLRARNNDRVQFYLMWANHDVNNLWDIRLSGDIQGNTIWQAGVDRAEFERLAARIVERYFGHPSYYKIDNKPVFMIYDLRTLVDGLGGIEATREALEWLRAHAQAAGLPGVHLQACARRSGHNLSGVDSSGPIDHRRAIEQLGFDSMTHYQFAHLGDMNRDYDAIVQDVESEWAILDKECSAPYFPHVSVGWDNNPRLKEYVPNVVKNNTPEAIERALRKAKAYADAHPDQPPLVTINSWNEWTETSYLEPDDLYGYGYLEAVRRVFQGE